jgi:hypothetical protein
MATRDLTKSLDRVYKDFSRAHLPWFATKTAEAYNIDPKVFLYLIAQESDWDPESENPQSGATGLGQILKEYHVQDPKTKEWYRGGPNSKYPGRTRFANLPYPEGVDWRKIPYLNIDHAAQYFSDQLETFNNRYDHALSAYFSGPTNTAQLIAAKGPEFYEASEHSNIKNYISNILNQGSQRTRWGYPITQEPVTPSPGTPESTRVFPEVALPTAGDPYSDFGPQADWFAPFRNRDWVTNPTAVDKDKLPTQLPLPPRIPAWDLRRYFGSPQPLTHSRSNIDDPSFLAQSLIRGDSPFQQAQNLLMRGVL